MRLFDGLGATNGPDPTVTMWPAYKQNGVSNTPQPPPFYGCDPYIDPVTGQGAGCPGFGAQPTPTPMPPLVSCPPGAYSVNGQPCGGGVYPQPPPTYPPPVQPYPPVQPLPPRNPVYTFTFPQQAPVTVQPQPAQLIAGISNTTLLIGGAILLLLVSRK